MSVTVHRAGRVTTVVLDRREVRNAVDPATAEALAAVFRAFDGDDESDVAVLFGAGKDFCAGADLRALEGGLWQRRLETSSEGPLGPTRMRLRKPVIAAVAGHAVAGGLELACWCDLRIVEESAIFGVYCRRFGVPLIDGGTVRLPRIVGEGRALDMVLTGRAVPAAEALAMGLATRVVPDGTAREAAEALAAEIAEHPQECLRNDRASLLEGQGLALDEALAREWSWGKKTLASGEASRGAGRFARGEGRGGRRL
jgi:enoyl-CoA hydratase